jgi:hypothetical protein
MTQTLYYGHRELFPTLIRTSNGDKATCLEYYEWPSWGGQGGGGTNKRRINRLTLLLSTNLLAVICRIDPQSIEKPAGSGVPQHWTAPPHHTKKQVISIAFELSLAMSVDSTELPPATGPVINDPAGWSLFVFRKNREPLSTRQLLNDLRSEIRRLAAGASPLDALVRAGELETGLEDAGSAAARSLAIVVDQLATLSCAGTSGDRSCLATILHLLDRLEAPSTITCSHPEGFSYYGLNPLDFADLAARIAPELASRVAVIGIRSVGSALGAVVAAQLRARGTDAERITVRPEGDPYRRQTSFSPPQQAWIRARLAEERDFLVVDEGPGFSGSTFLSVARALEKNGESGVPPARIVLMGSRPFPHHVAAEQAREWSRYRSWIIDYAAHAPAGAGRSLGDGAWRELLYPSRWQWPVCWVEQERVKHASRDGRMFFKFEGFGRFGELARAQAAQLAAAKLSPRCLDFEQGYGCYEFVAGRPLARSDLSEALLARMAAYCAFRVGRFPAPSSDLKILAVMARQNLEVEFGSRFRDFRIEIPLERPVYPDCRMLPHEWLMTPEGQALKTDGVGHAEGHQLPGPADIAWDLAGTIVEWNLSAAAADFFLETYRRRSGDSAAERVRFYVVLYSIFRMAQCRMSSVSMARRREARYIRRQYEEHARKVAALLAKWSF